MKPPDIARQRDRTEMFNDLVPLTMGLIKVLDDFAGSLDVTAGPAQPEALEAVGRDPLAFAFLGLLSLRRTVLRWAGEAGLDPGPAPDEAARTEAGQGRMLR